MRTVFVTMNTLCSTVPHYSKAKRRWWLRGSGSRKWQRTPASCWQHNVVNYDTQHSTPWVNTLYGGVAVLKLSDEPCEPTAAESVLYVPMIPVIVKLELRIRASSLKVLMTFLFESLAPCLSLPRIHLKMDCTVTWTNTLLRAAINSFCQKLQAGPDMSSITIYIKQRAFYDCQSQAALLWLY